MFKSERKKKKDAVHQSHQPRISKCKQPLKSSTLHMRVEITSIKVLYCHAMPCR